MGNCCGGESDERDTSSHDRGSRKQDSFQGQNKLDYQGHRLGSADEGRASTAPLASGMYRDNVNPEPVLVDPTLTDADREKIRADRAAAAEARMKKQGLNPKQKKKPSQSGEPLRGPNSEPLMRWNAAG